MLYKTDTTLGKLYPEGWSRVGEMMPSDGNLVRDAVAGLSDWDRAVIYRSYYLGQTTTQIAAEFRTDDELVKHDLHRALHALRANLRKQDDMTRRHLRVV
jgi:RNA polymerase sigma-70 factor (ECF subfamily)